MENIAPIIFLILYLVISRIAKRRRASQDKPAAPRVSPKRRGTPGPLRTILETLAEEGRREEKVSKPEPVTARDQWFGVEPPEVKEPAEMEPEPEPEPFIEGARSISREISVEDEDPYERPEETPYEYDEEQPYTRPEELPYERPTPRPYKRRVKGRILQGIEEMPFFRKGIILQEILGQPRALKDPQEWFHR